MVTIGRFQTPIIGRSLTATEIAPLPAAWDCRGYWTRGPLSLALSSLLRHRVIVICRAMRDVVNFAVVAFLIGVWAAALVVYFLR
jgi:hypothetical protein